VPDCFSASALGSAAECPLKLVISSVRSSDWRERLISGPESAVGTLFHRVLERTNQEDRASPERIFQEEYERTVRELRRDPRRAHFAELASTKSLVEWSRVKAWVLARAAQAGTATVSRWRSSDPARSPTGTEVWLESRKLRLRGRADKIRRLGPSLFELRDFKTGVTLDEQGQVKKEIALQLQAYGLMLLESRPSADVQLVVDDGEERYIPFDFDSRRAATDEIVRMTAPMPPAGRASAAELARPGRSCFACPVRHVCTAYLAIAPSWWRQYPSSINRLPNDSWGSAVEVVGQGQVDIVLRDAAERRVRIDGLADRHGITSSVVGKQVWLFDLQATGATRGFDGGRFHPRSFHELPRDRMERRAWATQAFLDVKGLSERRPT
jgi:RecB family exonuclease